MARFTRRRVSLILLTIALWLGVIVLPLLAILLGLDIPSNPFFAYLQYFSWLLPSVWTFIFWPWLDIAQPLDHDNPPPAKVLLRRLLISSMVGWVISMIPAALILTSLATEIMNDPIAYPIRYWIYPVIRLALLGIVLAALVIFMNRSAYRKLFTAYQQTRTCRSCGYNLNFVTAADCPECGHKHKLESKTEPT